MLFPWNTFNTERIVQMEKPGLGISTGIQGHNTGRDREVICGCAARLGWGNQEGDPSWVAAQGSESTDTEDL